MFLGQCGGDFRQRPVMIDEFDRHALGPPAVEIHADVVNQPAQQGPVARRPADLENLPQGAAARIAPRCVSGFNPVAPVAKNSEKTTLSDRELPSPLSPTSHAPDDQPSAIPAGQSGSAAGLSGAEAQARGDPAKLAADKRRADEDSRAPAASYRTSQVGGYGSAQAFRRDIQGIQRAGDSRAFSRARTSLKV